jgi:hypothetical protein
VSLHRYHYHDPKSDTDVWVEMLPKQVRKPLTEISPDDVEVDFVATGRTTLSPSTTRYHSVDVSTHRGASVVRVTYDCVYLEAIDDSEWRCVGKWGTGTTIPVNARVVYMIQEEEAPL